MNTAISKSTFVLAFGGQGMVCKPIEAQGFVANPNIGNKYPPKLETVITLQEMAQ